MRSSGRVGPGAEPLGGDPRAGAWWGGEGRGRKRGGGGASGNRGGRTGRERGAAGWRRIVLLDCHVRSPVVRGEVGGAACPGGRGAEGARQPLGPRGQGHGAVRGPSWGGGGGCRRGAEGLGHECKDGRSPRLPAASATKWRTRRPGRGESHKGAGRPRPPRCPPGPLAAAPRPGRCRRGNSSLGRGRREGLLDAPRGPRPARLAPPLPRRGGAAIPARPPRMWRRHRCP